jgi:hypothetical protein
VAEKQNALFFILVYLKKGIEQGLRSSKITAGTPTARSVQAESGSLLKNRFLLVQITFLA